MTIIYQDLTEQYVDSAVDTVELAFEGDPLDVWLYKDSEKKFRRAIRELGIRRGLKPGKKVLIAIDTDSDAVVGISVWEPPVSKKDAESQTWGEWLGGWQTWTQRKRLDWLYGPAPAVSICSV
ncbi:gnat family [Sugiyamaella lignohabitans]|uniref:Gnat family n=1 Tax=Sugiyamaella lignohabitans TaxID=796027 RepID=A0A167CY27_9ASCO|nr:gnat family [Sugiyamaella lignohabitans]ANB12243.1 gnat family [Sugiyamaella lignohabitans]